jgi:hypothetical protein
MPKHHKSKGARVLGIPFRSDEEPVSATCEELDHGMHASSAPLLSPRLDHLPVAHATPLVADFSSPGASLEDNHLLLVGLSEHDDDRASLALALHAATLRVQDTFACLKTSLEPLTFAYGEDDGHAYYEKIVNSPQAYRDGRSRGRRACCVPM